jgi:hypothetical protein
LPAAIIGGTTDLMVFHNPVRLVSRVYDIEPSELFDRIRHSRYSIRHQLS